MASSSPVWFRGFDAATGEVVERVLPLTPGSSCTVRVQPAAGASALLAILGAEKRVMLRAEVTPAQGPVTLRVEQTSDGNLRLTSAGKSVFTLPPEGADLLPSLAPLDATALDLAIVIDGTARALATEKGTLDHLLSDKGWRGKVGEIVELTKALSAQYPDLQATVLAFGDHAPARMEAEDLQPAYVLTPTTPAERDLRPLTAPAIEAALLRLFPSPGGDFVDALAEALHACVDISWRPEARHLVVVLGDSPGHSVLVPWSMKWEKELGIALDGHARSLDVDIEAIQLFRRQVEVMTIYQDLSRESGYYDRPETREPLEFARAQYTRLASRPNLAFQASSFDPTAAATAFIGGSPVFGRGACLGEIRDP